MLLTKPGSQNSYLNLKFLAIFLLLIIFSLHASQRGIGSDYDAHAYYEWFNLILNHSNTDFLSALAKSNIYFEGDFFFSFESGFAVVTFLISRFFSSVETFFFLITFFGLFIKFVAIRKTCNDFIWPIVFYLSWYYLLLEMTTIRAGVAASILIMGYFFLQNGKLWKYVFCVFIAGFFHISSFIALFLIFFQFKPLSKQTLVLAIIGSFFISYVSILPIIELAGIFNEKLLDYYSLYMYSDLYSSINRFNVVIILRIVLLFLGLYIVRDRYWKIQGFALSANCYALSIFTYYLFASFPILSGRLYELLGIFQIYFIANFMRIFKNKVYAVILISTVCILQFYILVFHSKFVDFFYFIGTPYNLQTTHAS
jgi:hypothetical protein